MLQSWSIPSDGEKFMEFASLSAEDKETNDNIKWWNQKLAELDQDLEVAAGAQAELRMNSPPRWVIF